MMWDHIAPYMGQLSDNQQRIIRYLYEQRYTRPYVGAMMGISMQQVMIEELAALRAVIEVGMQPITSAKDGPKRGRKPKADAAVGTKQARAAVGPSGVDT